MCCKSLSTENSCHIEKCGIVSVPCIVSGGKVAQLTFTFTLLKVLQKEVQKSKKPCL